MISATYNLRHGAPGAGWANTRAMARSVAALRADVIALQEVDRHVVRSWFVDQAGVAASASGMRASFAPARSMGPFGRYGNAVLVRGRTLDAAAWRLPGVGEPRVALFVRAVLRDVEVTVVATHLQNRSGSAPSEAPAQLEAVLAQLARWPEPWLVMGDLNLRASVVTPLFRDAGLTLHASDPTFPSSRPTVGIDWVASRGLGPALVTVPDLRTSDHRPVTAEFSEFDVRAHRCGRS